MSVERCTRIGGLLQFRLLLGFLHRLDSVSPTVAVIQHCSVDLLLGVTISFSLPGTTVGIGSHVDQLFLISHIKSDPHTNTSRAPTIKRCLHKSLSFLCVCKLCLCWTPDITAPKTPFTFKISEHLVTPASICVISRHEGFKYLDGHMC